MTFFILLLSTAFIAVMMHLLLHVDVTRQSLTQDVCCFLAVYCFVEILSELSGEYPVWALFFAVFDNFAFWICLMLFLVQRLDVNDKKRADKKRSEAEKARREDQDPYRLFR